MILLLMIQHLAMSSQSELPAFVRYTLWVLTGCITIAAGSIAAWSQLQTGKRARLEVQRILKAEAEADEQKKNAMLVQQAAEDRALAELGQIDPPMVRLLEVARKQSDLLDELKEGYITAAKLIKTLGMCLTGLLLVLIGSSLLQPRDGFWWWYMRSVQVVSVLSVAIVLFVQVYFSHSFANEHRQRDAAKNRLAD